MIKISGGPLPTTRYPTAPSLVCATRTGADTTEAVAAVGFTDEEPHALTATDTTPAVRPRAIPRRNARRPSAARTWLLPVVLLAAVMPGVPALPARWIGIVVVHVLSSTVGRARQRSRPESNDARECVYG